MSDGDEYVFYEKLTHKKTILFILFGILVLIFIYLPFFSRNLKYSADTTFTSIFLSIGGFFSTIGMLMLVVGILLLFIRGRGLKLMIFGFIFLTIGLWFLGPKAGIGNVAESVPKGYH